MRIVQTKMFPSTWVTKSTLCPNTGPNQDLYSHTVSVALSATNVDICWNCFMPVVTTFLVGLFLFTVNLTLLVHGSYQFLCDWWSLISGCDNCECDGHHSSIVFLVQCVIPLQTSDCLQLWFQIQSLALKFKPGNPVGLYSCGFGLFSGLHLVPIWWRASYIPRDLVRIQQGR